MIKPDVPVVFLHPGLNGVPSLSNADHPTVAGDAVNAQCFKAEVIFDRPMGTVDLRWEAYSFDVMS
jgi:hypothetical protein